jgi:ADP-ribose pyrophosphatase
MGDFFIGTLSTPAMRINFERGDSVGALLYDPRSDGPRQVWLLEIAASVQKASRTVKEVARKEVLEKADCQVRGKLQSIATIYPSPDGTSERITLFLGEVAAGRRAGQGGVSPPRARIPRSWCCPSGRLWT